MFEDRMNMSHVCQCGAALSCCRSISTAGIFYKCPIADSHQADAHTNTNCSPWLNDDSAILAHS